MYNILLLKLHVNGETKKKKEALLYLLLRELPVVGLQLVQLVKLNADVFY